MTALADVLDASTATRLASLRDELVVDEEIVAVTAIEPVCPACHQRLPVPAARFSDGA